MQCNLTKFEPKNLNLKPQSDTTSKDGSQHRAALLSNASLCVLVSLLFVADGVMAFFNRKKEMYEY